MIEDEVERINKIILKREKAIKKGNESEVEDIEEYLRKDGFEVRDTDDITYVERKKKTNI